MNATQTPARIALTDLANGLRAFVAQDDRKAHVATSGAKPYKTLVRDMKANATRIADMLDSRDDMAALDLVVGFWGTMVNMDPDGFVFGGYLDAAKSAAYAARPDRRN